LSPLQPTLRFPDTPLPNPQWQIQQVHLHWLLALATDTMGGKGWGRGLAPQQSGGWEGITESQNSRGWKGPLWVI